MIIRYVRLLLISFLKSRQVILAIVLLPFMLSLPQQHVYPLVPSTAPSKSPKAANQDWHSLIVLFMPHKNDAVVDLLITHALGCKNYHAFQLDEQFSYAHLLKAIGYTLAAGAVVLPLVNLLPEIEENFKGAIQATIPITRDSLVDITQVTTTLAIGLLFHMHYDNTFHDATRENNYQKLLLIVTQTAVEGAVFYGLFSLAGSAIDQIINVLNPSDTRDDYYRYFLPINQSLLLDSLVLLSLAHVNYDKHGLSERPSLIKVLQATGMTLLQGSILFPCINVASAFIEDIQKNSAEYLTITRSYLISLADLLSAVATELIFHMHYDHAFHNRHTRPTQTSLDFYAQLARVMAITSAQGAASYGIFYLLALSFDRGFDLITDQQREILEPIAPIAHAQ